MQAMLDLDGSILLWIQAHVRAEALNPVVTFVTHLGDSGWFWIVVALALFAFRRTRRVGLACMIAMLFGLLATDLFLKNWVARVRPYEVVEGLERIIGVQKDFSFPSGHTTNGIACAWVIFRRAPKRYGAPALALAILIALTRLYVGVHYPSDVLGGVVVGLTGAAVALRLEPLLQRELPALRRFCAERPSPKE